jgi:hypothetical protein
MKVTVGKDEIAFVINCRDRLADLRKLLHWVMNINEYPVKIVLLDNNSTYKPLLSYYETLPSNIQVIKFEKNYGRRAIKRLLIRSKIPFYIYTDCDIVPKETCPPNVISHLINLAKRYPHVHKVGLGIEYEDLPEHNELKTHIVLAQKKHHEKETPGKEAYITEVKSKFALYRIQISEVMQFKNNLRTKKPFIARHQTWYLNTHDLPKDFLHYARNASADSSVSKFMDRSGILNMNRKTIKRHTKLTLEDSGPPALGRIVGKTFSHITAKGTKTDIVFITNKICKGWGSDIGDVTGQGRRITIRWRSGSKSVVVLDFKHDLKSYTGISDNDGAVHGNLLESDFTKSSAASRKFTAANPPKRQPRKALRSSAFKRADNNVTMKSPMYMVVSGYRIPVPRIRDFLVWNRELFEKYDIRVLIVVDRPINNITQRFKFAKTLLYPTKQKMFSIGKTINYGLKRVPNNDSIVIKTDIDIIFSESVIDHLRRSVVSGSGTICLCHHIADPRVIHQKSTKWNMHKKDSEGRGACFAMVQRDWEYLNGYDERIRGWGGDDTEMWMRAKKHMYVKTSKQHPLFHVKHPPRTVKGYFPHRSGENMEIANKGDWKSEHWGEAGIFDTQKTFVLAITTVNRVHYLRDCIDTWATTRCKSVNWKLIVADDGSTDGTIDYVESLNIPNVEIMLIRNKKRGVHHQVNTIIKALNQTHFDVCFKVDDDVLFAKPDWDIVYYTEIIRTGYDHLCLYQPEWRKGRSVKTYNGLVSMIDIDNVQGAFYTLTKNVIKEVGYMDTKNFGLTGLGHVDFTARCCRAGFNIIESPLDVVDSKDYIKLQKGNNYQSAIPMTWRNKENTSAVLRKKRAMVKDASRKHVPYSETKMRVGDKK